MCSATDSYDIALAMEGVSLDDVYNKNISDLDIKHKLNYDNTFAFTNFMLKRDRKEYEFSDIDTYETRYMQVCERNDKFKLQTIPASERDLCMITQDHVRSIKGFWGMTCGFQIQFIKPDAHILATTDNTSEARYLYGNFGKGSWTFFAGHDPEQYQHHMEDAASDLSLTPNSPGYRLILDNVFLSAVKRENTQSVSMNNVNIFPNPVVTNGMLMINAGMAQASQVRIRLYSLSGQLLVDRSMDANAGENELKFDMSGIASGLYQLEFTAGTEKKNFKVVVQ
ncbi:MAG TPA: T9SS type A sorting domain-containing protein, partial [Bacteroidia bacterium]